MAENSTGIEGTSSGVGTPKKPKIRIVVADDHPIFRDGLCRLLALEEDFEVVAQAQDGRQVLDVLQQHEPDILLLDLKMPGLDGLATLQRIEQNDGLVQANFSTVMKIQSALERAGIEFTDDDGFVGVRVSKKRW